MTQVLGPQRQDQTYTFSSHPSAIQTKQKYRNRAQKNDEESVEKHRYGNLMYDRRVVRGNTYSQHLLPVLTGQEDPIEQQHQQEEARKRAFAKKRARDQLRPRTPDAIEGRQHQDVQTELYLEELADRIEEADVEAQTDDFLDRPSTPLFVPAKSGVDVATEIMPGDLFHFDTEVKPILEVLVGKTLEQSTLEVMEEEELESLRCQQRMFLELRSAEKVEQQRLEEQDRRLREEKKRRMDQKLELLQMEKDTAEKVAAKVFAQSYLADLVPSVFGTLADNGYFFDPVERDVEVGFLPWLMENVCEELDVQNESRLIVDLMIRQAVTERHIGYYELAEQYRKAKKVKEEETALGGVIDTNGDEDEEQKVEDTTEEKTDEVTEENTPKEDIKPAEGGEIEEDDGGDTTRQGGDLSQIIEENPEETVEGTTED